MINVEFNGVTYQIPQTSNEPWGDQATNYLVALAEGTLQPTGGGFPLLAEVDFGEDFGLKAPYFKSASEDFPATAGVLRLAREDLIAWRNESDDGNWTLGVDENGNLEFSGNAISADPLITSEIRSPSSLSIYTNDVLSAVLDGSSNFAVGGDVSATGSLSGSNFSGSSSGTNTGDVTIGSFGSTPNANGLSLSGQALTLQPANASNPGAVSKADQEFSGIKTMLDGLVVGDEELPQSATDGFLYLPSIEDEPSGTPTTQGDTIPLVFNNDDNRFYFYANNTWNQLVNDVSLTVGTFGNAPNSNGASIAGDVLTLQPANGSNPGAVSTGTQTFAGAKTFNNTVTLPNAEFTQNTSGIILDAKNAPAIPDGRQIIRLASTFSGNQYGGAIAGGFNSSGSFGVLKILTQFGAGFIDVATFTSDGMVGIGTENPTALLNIDASSISATSPEIHLTKVDDSGNPGLSAVIRGRYARNGLNPPQNGDRLFTLVSQGYDGIGYDNAGAIGFNATETWSDTAKGCDIRFFVTPTGTVDQFEAIRIQNDGQLRIATPKTPSGPSDTGVAGTVAWDANYIYVCINTNTWKRVAIDDGGW